MPPRASVVLTTMSFLSHRRFRSEVHRLIDGELPYDRVHALGTHLGACERCRGDLGWWLAIRDALCRDLGPSPQASEVE